MALESIRMHSIWRKEHAEHEHRSRELIRKHQIQLKEPQPWSYERPFCVRPMATHYSVPMTCMDLDPLAKMLTALGTWRGERCDARGHP